MSVFEQGQFSWSPGGKRIVFTHSVDGHSALSVIGIDGRGRRQLTRPESADDKFPVWSPDGKLIAFVRDGGNCGRPRGVCGGLFVVDANGKHLRRIPTGSTDGLVGRPSWSPDGKRLAFGICCGGGAYVVNVSGRGLHEVSPKRTFAGVVWSPDGKLIALGGYGGTFVVRPNGAAYRQLSSSGDSAPSWSPDSRALVLEDHCCAPDLVVVAVDGSGERRVTEGWRYGYGNYDPEWSPRAFPIARVGGESVSPANPTDSRAAANVLRTRNVIRRLAADGTRVAVVDGDNRAEAWEPLSGSIVRFGGFWPSTYGFALAGERVAMTSLSSGLGVDSWYVNAALIALPRSTVLSLGPLIGWSRPVEHLRGDGSLLVADAWGWCRISLSPPCAHEQKQSGQIVRVNDDGVTQIAQDPGALTLLAVDDDRILVDRENGMLQIFHADGRALRSIAYGPAKLLAAQLEGNDVVVLTSSDLADYDSETGVLRHQWSVASSDIALSGLQGGIVAYVAGRDIHILRLGDGAEAVIHVEQAPPILAELSEAGLFYSLTAEDTAFRGRVVFVPFGSLPLP